jgi:hypothetical protein
VLLDLVLGGPFSWSSSLSAKKICFRAWSLVSDSLAIKGLAAQIDGSREICNPEKWPERGTP